MNVNRSQAALFGEFALVNRAWFAAPVGNAARTSGLGERVVEVLAKRVGLLTQPEISANKTKFISFLTNVFVVPV